MLSLRRGGAAYTWALSVLAWAWTAPATAAGDLVDSSQYPWAAVGRVNFQIGGYCTGTLVAPSLVLTAAHCLYVRGVELWFPARFLRFTAGRRESAFLAEATAVDYRVSAGFDPTNRTEIKNMTYDWALITLDKPIGDEVGFIGVVNIERDGFAPLRARASGFARAGYGAEQPERLSVDSGCTVEGFFDDQELLAHKCPTTLGDSGGPILALLPDGPRIIGVHSGRLDSKEGQWGAAVPASTFYQSIAFTKTGQIAGAENPAGYAGVPPQTARADGAAVAPPVAAVAP